MSGKKSFRNASLALAFKLHEWAAWIIVLPLTLVITTGLLLQLKKQIEWVQPPTQRGAGIEPTIAFPDVLAAFRSVEIANIKDWSDLSRLEVHVDKGVIKGIGHSRWEVQVDVKTGAVVQTAYRRSDLIESLHDGSFFGDTAKLGIFLPAGFLLLGLWMTGLWILIVRLFPRRRTQARPHG